MSNQPYFAHPTAILDDGCEVGEGSKIWHFCHVSTGAVLGKNCSLGQNVFIAPGVRLGDGVKVQNNVSIYAGVEIGDDVFIGPSAVFTNVVNPRSAIDRRGEFSKTLVKKGATIGANATIVCGIEIGEFAFVGAGAVVTRSVLPNSMVVGNPAKHRGWMSETGEKLVFDEKGESVCSGTGSRYQLADGRVQKLPPVAPKPRRSLHFFKNFEEQRAFEIDAILKQDPAERIARTVELIKKTYGPRPERMPRKLVFTT